MHLSRSYSLYYMSAIYHVRDHILSKVLLDLHKKLSVLYFVFPASNNFPSIIIIIIIIIVYYIFRCRVSFRGIFSL